MHVLFSLSLSVGSIALHPNAQAYPYVMFINYYRPRCAERSSWGGRGRVGRVWGCVVVGASICWVNGSVVSSRFGQEFFRLVLALDPPPHQPSLFPPSPHPQHERFSRELSRGQDRPRRPGIQPARAGEGVFNPSARRSGGGEVGAASLVGSLRRWEDNMELMKRWIIGGGC